jgi:adenylate cyclase class IV
MARNIEIKARVDSARALQPRVDALAAEGPFEIRQDDTFFRCEEGRLKLRDFLDGSGELIFYRRADEAGPKESFYLRSATSTPAALRESLSLAYGQAGRVVKRRVLFMAGRTRIHLDEVEGLGDFVELEVVLGEREAAEHGIREATELMGRLGIEPHQLLEGAYVDLLAPAATTAP